MPGAEGDWDFNTRARSATLIEMERARSGESEYPRRTRRGTAKHEVQAI